MRNAKNREIDRTYEALIRKNPQLCLMNCVSEYPPDYADINLKVINSESCCGMPKFEMGDLKSVEKFKKQNRYS